MQEERRLYGELRISPILPLDQDTHCGMAFSGIDEPHAFRLHAVHPSDGYEIGCAVSAMHHRETAAVFQKVLRRLENVCERCIHLIARTGDTLQHAHLARPHFTIRGICEHQ